MTVRQPLFQQNDTADQTAEVFRLWLKDLVNERPGIMQETAFQVTQRGAGANNSVDVQVGGILIPGTQSGTQGYYYASNDAVLNVPMSTAAHATLPRIDTVLVEVRDSFYSGVNNDARVVYQAGTAASSPVAPNLDSLGYENYWRLANINVPANDNTIITGDITDLRTSTTVVPAQGRATGLGGIITCTSTTRPASPRHGQIIWESNTKRIVVNEGTASSVNWVAYASSASGIGPWTDYTPTISSASLGTGGVKYGRYFKYSTLVAGVAGFRLGTGGDVTNTIQVSLPVPCTSAVASDLRYIGAGKAFDASGPVYWASTAHIHPVFSTNLITDFATAGQAAWSAASPFNWTSNDIFQCLFVYEAAS
jgi:hypothetical protein